MDNTSISNMDDVIDSRAVEERIEELRDELFDARDDESLGREEELTAEITVLAELAEAGAQCSDDWEHGVTLIRDSYFKQYAMEFADDIGALNGADTWPLTCIDWDQAARELQMDYSSVEFDGVTYWVG